MARYYCHFAWCILGLLCHVVDSQHQSQRGQQLYETCTAYTYRHLDTDLKLEHQCLLLQQMQNEIFVDREERLRRYANIDMLNKKLNYLIEDLKPEFVDPFELTDETIIFDALMDLTDGRGRSWKLVKKSTLDKLRKSISNKAEECKKIPTLQQNVDFEQYPQDCYELWEQGVRVDGIYAIRLFSGVIINVYCDMTTDGGGWTVIQRRSDGSVDFNRTWADYKSGFGNPNGEFWIGLENLYLLSTNRNSSLRVDLHDWEGDRAYAEYLIFYVADERSSNYTLTVDGVSGDAGDSLKYHSGMQFSTADRDNDDWEDSCAGMDGAGWWYRGCSFATLNSKYYNMTELDKPPVDGITWYHWKEQYAHILKSTEIKTRLMQVIP